NITPFPYTTLFRSRKQRLDRHLAEHGTTAHDPRLRRRIVRRCPMHETAVIPNDQLAGLPAMLVGEIGMNGKRIQLLDQRPSFGVRHADDVLRVIAEIETLAMGLRMCAHNGVINRW